MTEASETGEELMKWLGDFGRAKANHMYARLTSEEPVIGGVQSGIAVSDDRIDLDYQSDNWNRSLICFLAVVRDGKPHLLVQRFTGPDEECYGDAEEWAQRERAGGNGSA